MAGINKEENQEDYKPFSQNNDFKGSKQNTTGEGDKDSPQASAGKTDLGSTSQKVKKEVSQPGGEENASGKDNEDLKADHNQIGASPIPESRINKGTEKL